MSFPTLTCSPSTITSQPKFNTISIEFDGGYKQTRERHTRALHTFKVSYQLMSKADTILVKNHYALARGSTPFTWHNDDDNTNYTVRYTAPVVIPATGTTTGYYTMSLELEEV